MSAWSRARELAERTPETRNRYVDFLRAASIAVVVTGHWLMAAPVVNRAELTLSNMLHAAPWTQWLTWLFQVMHWAESETRVRSDSAAVSSCSRWPARP